MTYWATELIEEHVTRRDAERALESYLGQEDYLGGRILGKEDPFLVQAFFPDEEEAAFFAQGCSRVAVPVGLQRRLQFPDAQPTLEEVVNDEVPPRIAALHADYLKQAAKLPLVDLETGKPTDPRLLPPSNESLIRKNPPEQKKDKADLMLFLVGCIVGLILGIIVFGCNGGPV